ncbi:MAG: DUF2069 domain-containing protein [Cocleimonas sp.]
MDITTFWRVLAAIGIIGLIILIVVWNGWMTPIQKIPRSIEIALMVAPLLYFLRGILHGNRDTFIAVMLLSFVYILMGIWYLYSDQERIYGMLMLVASISLFFGTLLNVWILDKRDKQKNSKP